MAKKISETDLSFLLSRFNDRDNSAFCKIYEIIYDELFYFTYISVKNKFRDYISHRKCKDKFHDAMRLTDDYFISQIAESETLSIITEAVKALPAECAKVFRMFIDGWEVKDIATSLNKSQSTVYAQKQEAITILKKKFPKDKLLLIMMLVNP
ncbi:MAG: sigma-70 family RNA polymerase sigma factor [Rikenellaceae bacterium]